MTRRLNVMALMDEACIPEHDPTFQGLAEPDQSTEFHVVTALRELGHEVLIQPVCRDVGELVHALETAGPDLVFNLTEEFAGNRRYDRNIAALLEMLDIPFTGTGSAGLMLSRGKGLCKKLLAHHHLRVPRFLVYAPGRAIRVPTGFPFPALVKPAYGDGSEGIHMSSLVSDADALVQRVQRVHQRWRQPAVAEEYIAGRELYVGILGNRRLQVLPPREIFFERARDAGPVMATYRVKWDDAYRRLWKIRFGFAELTETELRRVSNQCKRAYRVLQLRDYGRIDIRLRPDGNIVVLEANANPDIAYGDELAESAERAGLSYNMLIDRVIRLACRRHER